MSVPLVLSLFPGIGLLDTAFEENGFCVVRGPDLLWGGDVRLFTPPPESLRRRNRWPAVPSTQHGQRDSGNGGDRHDP
jgi:hypothetical protein